MLFYNTLSFGRWCLGADRWRLVFGPIRDLRKIGLKEYLGWKAFRLWRLEIMWRTE